MRLMISSWNWNCNNRLVNNIAKLSSIVISPFVSCIDEQTKIKLTQKRNEKSTKDWHVMEVWKDTGDEVESRA